MEPVVISALVSAAGNLLAKVIEWVGQRDNKGAAHAKEVVERTYDTLKGNLTDGCVRVLKLLESGEHLLPSQIRKDIYPALKPPKEVTGPFDSEFRYRLEYLRLNGVVTLVGGSEYGITRLGQAFLEEARRRRDYYKELFDKR